MRTCLFISIILVLISYSFFAQEALKDDQKTEAKENISSTSDLVYEKLLKIEQQLQQPASAKCKDVKEIVLWQWIIVFFMPVTMLLFAMYFIWKFKGSKEFTASRIIGLPNTGGRSGENVLMSSSRFIALLTGLTSIFVVATLMMYYGYILVAECEIELPLTQLWTIIAGLGIGIIPYGFNVWNKNEKEKRSTNSEIRKDQ